MVVTHVLYSRLCYGAKLIQLYLFNPSNAELNPTCHLLALLEAHHMLHVSRIRVNVFGSVHLCEVSMK
jgi:hypothetical protein